MFPYIGMCHHPNRRTHSFQRGRSTTDWFRLDPSQCWRRRHVQELRGATNGPAPKSCSKAGPSEYTQNGRYLFRYRNGKYTMGFWWILYNVPILNELFWNCFDGFCIMFPYITSFHVYIYIYTHIYIIFHIYHISDKIFYHWIYLIILLYLEYYIKWEIHSLLLLSSSLYYIYIYIYEYIYMVSGLSPYIYIYMCVYRTSKMTFINYWF